LQQVGFAKEVRMAPDEDGDGRPELLVGSPPGKVVVLSGVAAARGGDVRPLHECELRGIRDDTRFLGLAGDPNADGIPDYLISDPDVFGDSFEHAPGRVYLLFGGYETQVLSVTGVSPARGPIKESTEVTVSGTGFVAGARVLFGGEEATKVEL